MRVDVAEATRSYAVLGLQGTAPYWIHYDAAAFLSDKGDLTARIEAEYDQKLTQSLILQPRVEIALSAQEIPEAGIGAGLSGFSTGLRLRYEIVREFAPYIGLEWQQQLGDTAQYSRQAGHDPSRIAILLGIRSWF